MKKWLLLVPTLFLAIQVLGQGIEFEHGSWNEVLDKAQKSNKPIFVDIYTTWCGPCKMMSKDIFPLEEVGKEFNTNYICYKIDAEKGEGINIAKQYEVKAYPTYLFIKPDGTLFYKALGSMPANKFIEESKKAIAEFNDPKPLSAWDQEYATKKNNPEFMIGYIEKRAKLGLDNGSQFNEYLQIIPKSELTSPKVVELYKKEGANLKATTFAYSNLLNNRGSYESAFGAEKDYVKSILSRGVYNSLVSAIKEKKENDLKDIVAINSKLTEDDGKMNNDQIYMTYYKNTKDYTKFTAHAIKYGNSILSMSDEKIAEKDKENLKSLEDLIKSGKVDTVKVGAAKIAQAREYYGSMEKQKISGNLNEIAWTIFDNISDKSSLEFALKCSKRSVELTPSNSAVIDTYSNVLYKLGKKKEAIEKQQSILKLLTKDTDAYKNAEEIIKKMESGEKTWK